MIQQYWELLRKYFTPQAWQFLFILLSLSWLFAPSVNHLANAQTNFISHFEDAGSPWAWLFRLCDLIAALLLAYGATVFVQASDFRRKVTRQLLWLASAGLIIDVLFPSGCNGGLCLASTGLSQSIHTGESIFTSLVLVCLSAIWFGANVGWARVVFFVQLAALALLAYANYRPFVGTTLIQFSYQIIVTLWLAGLVIAISQRKVTTPLSSRISVHVIAGWIFFNGLVAMISAFVNFQASSRLSRVYFGGNTAWLAQHGIATGIALIFVSRHLWRNEYRAWQLTCLLLWLETIKYGVLTPNIFYTALFGATATVLFCLRANFNRYTSLETINVRLKQFGLLGAAALGTLLISVLILKSRHHTDIDDTAFDLVRFLRHFFLVDIANDIAPTPRRLLDQMANFAGLSLLVALLFSLFKPRRLIYSDSSRQERRQVRSLLERASSSSEDYFKYWPAWKHYWWNTERTAFIAYQVVGNVAFALADPIGPSAAIRTQAIKDFLTYCRQNGWRACFLMVEEGRRHQYRRQGLKLSRIGASARINLEQFAEHTLRNKWWRWVQNKARRQNWQHEIATPPHSPALLRELRDISDSWLRTGGHVERGFALGYFNEAYLQDCRLHLLRDDHNIIAFANELPKFNNSTTATIDLMRFRADANHALPALLALSLQELLREGQNKIFDLGFVPLASPSKKVESIIRDVGQIIIGPAVSARGLEQFKNKFEPHWRGNYIAFDGDWIDLIHVTRGLDELLRP